jgi:hypothetical protein
VVIEDFGRMVRRARELLPIEREVELLSKEPGVSIMKVRLHIISLIPEMYTKETEDVNLPWLSQSLDTRLFPIQNVPTSKPVHLGLNGFLRSALLHVMRGPEDPGDPTSHH